MTKKILKGITWNHSRGITPLLAASQRYTELYKDVEIIWHKRTLQEFADFPIENLTEQYDLLIIDHPWVGTANYTNCVLPLNEYLSEAYLTDQLQNQVGGSHQSYNYGNKQWALAVDAATPAASYRKDLFEESNIPIPTTWHEVIYLAKQGKVAVPAIPIDLLMNFYSFCIAQGESPFASKDEIVSELIGLKAINSMIELYSKVDKKMFDFNPITVAEEMSTSNKYWYCPFAYCYSNYSRVGYANNILTYTNTAIFNNQHLRTTIGGTGIAVSASSNYKAEAVDFAQWVVSPKIQQTIYVQNGGQPGHLAAWQNEQANEITNNFFSNILPVMQNGYIRPRYHGYLHFQDNAGLPLQICIKENGEAKATLTTMNKIYKESLLISKGSNE